MEHLAPLLSSCKDVTEAELATAASAAVAAIVLGSRAEDALGEATAPSLRNAYAGISLLFAEAAKLQLSQRELTTTLADLGVFDTRAASVAAAYAAAAPQLRAVLLRTSCASALPQLTGCRWRVDLPASSSALRAGAAQPPLFRLQLLAQPSAAQQAGSVPLVGGYSDEELCFWLSTEQMQQLSGTLKEALAAAQRLGREKAS